MTETERADEIVRGPRRRFAQNIAMISALLVSFVAIGVVWHDAQVRAENAETSAVSLAEQVQDACESQGSLDLDGRDLCEQADDVVEDPGTEVVPANGRDGARGPAGVQGIQGREGPPGEMGPPGPIGPRGEPGEDSTVPGPAGFNGLNGSDGRGILSMQCASGGWIIEYTDGIAGSDSGPCEGVQGPRGEPGTDSTVPGPQGERGPQGTAQPGTYTCPDGEHMTGFTVAQDGAVTLSCQAATPPPVIGPPIPEEG